MVALSHPSSICVSSFSKAVHRENKEGMWFPSQSLEELLAVTLIGTAVYMDTLSEAAHPGSAPHLCKYLCKVQRNTMGHARLPLGK